MAVRDRGPKSPSQVDKFGLARSQRRRSARRPPGNAGPFAETGTRDQQVTGFSVGINVGHDAGQNIFRVHVQLIPRRHGDVENPRGIDVALNRLT
jgi:hypothetical protein